MTSTHSKHASKEVSASHTSQTRYIVPIIGLNRPEKQTLNKGEYVVLKCRTTLRMRLHRRTICLYRTLVLVLLRSGFVS